MNHKLSAIDALAILEANLACPTSQRCLYESLLKVQAHEGLTGMRNVLDLLAKQVKAGETDNALFCVGELITCLDFRKCILTPEVTS